MISSHVNKQNKIKTSWRNKMESNPEFSERKAKEVNWRGGLHCFYYVIFFCQIEAAAQYFKKRLRILEITSDNSWGMARNASK